MRCSGFVLIAGLLWTLPGTVQGQAGNSRARILAAIDSGNVGEARARIEGTRQQLPAATVLFLEGRLEFALERFEAARDLFVKAQQADSRSAEAVVWEGNASAQLAMRASPLTKLSHGKRALDAWERALVVDQRNVSALENIVTYHLSVPGWLGGGRERAAPYAVRLAGVQPFMGGLALASVASSEARADSVLRAMVAAYPDSTAPYQRLVARLQDRGDHEGAEVLTRSRLARHPEDRTALFYRGRGAALSGRDVAGGIEALQHFLRLPGDGAGNITLYGGYFRLGQLYETAGDSAAAIEAFRSVLRLRPDHEGASAALKRMGAR